MSKPEDPLEAISPAPACPDGNQPVWERCSPQLSADGDSRDSHGI